MVGPCHMGEEKKKKEETSHTQYIDLSTGHAVCFILDGTDLNNASQKKKKKSLGPRVTGLT